jgi:hypothetical protein
LAGPDGFHAARATALIRNTLLAAPILLAGCSGGKPEATPDLHFTPIAPNVFAVAIDPLADVPRTEAAIRRQCADTPACTVLGWSDAAAVVYTFPLTNPQIATLAVRYTRDPLQGTDEMEWDCLQFRTARAPCIPKA